MTKVAIIIVNYRSAALTLDCLGSLAADGYSRQRARILLVDNASGDGSLETLRNAIAARGWAGWVTLLESPRNGGFAAGNNLAICHALHGNNPPEYLFLLNPDTLVYPLTVEALVCFLDQHARAGIAGSRLFDRGGVLQGGAHRFPSPLGELQSSLNLGVVSRMLSPWRVSPPARDDAHTCDWVSGAALMIRADVVRKIGLLDEAFFLYFEEVDWCRRAKIAGNEIWHIPASRVAHLEGASTGVSQVLPGGPHWRASRSRYFKKHHGVAGLACANACLTAGTCGNLLLRPLRAALKPHRLSAKRRPSLSILHWRSVGERT